jgi:predicted transcriptional regulator
MNSQLLIDAIVRQSMVLIAQVSTAEGVRSPLSHVADEVFMSLVHELESQGLGKKVIADMFGLAERSYRQKVQRLSESVTSRGVTLWGAVHTFLAERDTATRAEILEHFRMDEELTVRSILNDLVETGLVCRIGRGRETSYRVATEEELEELGASASGDSGEAGEALVWLHVAREGPLRQEQLAERVPVAPSALADALHRLVLSGRIRVESGLDGDRYTTDQCLIPVGESCGWEAAVIDHHRAVLAALAAKVLGGPHVSAPKEEVGGTTLRFDLWTGHPRDREVRDLLVETRARIIALWGEVEAHNRAHPQEISHHVTFYCGQYVTNEKEDV